LFAPFTRGAVGADQLGVGLGFTSSPKSRAPNGRTIGVTSTKDEPAQFLYADQIEESDWILHGTAPTRRLAEPC
jgi:hypothetical protein